MVTAACQPEPQSDVFEKTAVVAAADAGEAIQKAVPVAARAAATERTSDRERRK
jgi:hypothetical protein